MWSITLILALQVLAVSAKLRTYNWNVGWVTAAPDGFSRPFIGINGQWPNPTIDVNIGDIVKINLQNSLGNESTALHFHGIFQINSTMMDGPAMVTQCPIPPGQAFVYEFTINQPGTYWWHAHIGAQYVDGLRGPLIVHDPAAPYGKVDQEMVMTISDLYHDQVPSLLTYYQSPDNYNDNGGTEPVPDSGLINDSQNVNFTIVPGKTYLFRIINVGAFAAFWVQFDQHDLSVVEVDGVYVEPYTVSQLYLTVAQRYSVIVEAKTDKSQNYAIVASMNTDMFNYFTTPADLDTNANAYLVYDATKPLPAPLNLSPVPFDDTWFVPVDQTPLFDPPDVSLQLTASFAPNEQSQYRGYFNGISYVPQKVPTLYTTLSAPENLVSNPTIYGTYSNPFILPYNTTIEITIDNHDSAHHPFHLHGHNFQVISRSGYSSNFPGLDNIPSIPMRRDTVLVYSQGSATIRFRATNPGIQLFHCHVEWHVEAGLVATFIEAPDVLKATLPHIPGSHNLACGAGGISQKGNAAGNKVDWLNLTGQNSEPALNDYGALTQASTKRQISRWLSKRDRA